MTEKFIPREKLGKRARRAADAAKRRTWDCSPVPRIMESRNRYNRTEENARCRKDETGDVFLFLAKNSRPDGTGTGNF